MNQKVEMIAALVSYFDCSYCKVWGSGLKGTRRGGSKGLLVTQCSRGSITNAHCEDLPRYTVSKDKDQVEVNPRSE